MNDKMNVYVFYYSEVGIEKYKARLSDQLSSSDRCTSPIFLHKATVIPRCALKRL